MGLTGCLQKPHGVIWYQSFFQDAGFESRFTGTADAWLQRRTELTHVAVCGWRWEMHLQHRSLIQYSLQVIVAHATCYNSLPQNQFSSSRVKCNNFEQWTH